MAENFVYNHKHRILVCLICESCIVPTAKGLNNHLRHPPHMLVGTPMKNAKDSLKKFFYRLRSQDELQHEKLSERPAILGLKIYHGYRCLQDGCDFAAPNKSAAKVHDSTVHGFYIKGSAPPPPSRFAPTPFQSYFASNNLRRYFPVTVTASASALPIQEAPAEASHAVAATAMLASSEAMTREANRELRWEGGIMPAVPADESARVPWLVRLGIQHHLHGLTDDAIHASYCLPDNKTSRATRDGDNLVLLLAVAETTLWRAYQSCRRVGNSRWAMTLQRARTLGALRPGGEEDTLGFCRFQEESSLKSYFCRAKQLLVFYCRVVHADGGHFRPRTAPEDAPRPEDIIQATDLQRETMARLLVSLQKEVEGGAQPEQIANDSAIQDIALTMFYSLICQDTSSQHFCSPVLSFCAMLARHIRPQGSGRGAKDDTIGCGSWHDPGDLNSLLSALTWTGQLVLYDYVCRFLTTDDGIQVLPVLQRMCRQYMHHDCETAFGRLLQWRSYLFETSRTPNAAMRAIWSVDGQRVTYKGTELAIAQVTQLAAWAFAEAHRLLYGTLMFGTPLVRPLTAKAVQDDLTAKDFGGSWLTNGLNTALLEGTQSALFSAITQHEARHLPARAVYEDHIQQFLGLLAVLTHITPGPPLRASELLSVEWMNTGWRRNIYVYKGQVLLHLDHHKSQAQIGECRDNVRFLPSAVGDLLLVFLAYVQPLRTVFLREDQPDELLSAYLWSHLDGTLWRDEDLAQCLHRACVAAEVPRFEVAWWRQVAAAAIREMFGPPEQEIFAAAGVDVSEVVEVGDDKEMAALAGMSNHSARTRNTTLTRDMLLESAYEASTSWHQMFGFNNLAPPSNLLGAERPYAAAGHEFVRLVERVRPRPPLIYDEATLLAAARAVLKNPGLIFGTGQRDGVLATLGPLPAEQVVLVLGQGAGKTLVVLVGTAVQGAETTILVLPTMAPSSDMQDHLNQHGIQYHVWTPASTPSAKVVLVSVEAACSESFLRFAHRLAGRQQLDRIVVDECHLTVTATDRPCLRQLGRFLRQIQTQTVWLTATLSPSMESLFLERNHLVQPCIVRASTNRGNIQYRVYRTARSVLDSIAQLVDRFQPQPRPGGHEHRDRILVYCATRAMALDAAEWVGCEAYATDDEDETEKAAILRRWLAAAGGSNVSRTLVTTSALGIGFKYPCIRVVVHAGRPWRMSDFAHESGQAGRDGLPAKSIIVVGDKEVEQRVEAGPYDGGVGSKGRADDALDRHAMDMYLSSRYCLRGVLCEYLDDPADWRWCMEPDIPCAVCRVVHQEPRPSGTAWFGSAHREDDNAADDAEAMVWTGLDEVCDKTESARA